jgi:hypothetical protein
MPFLLTHKKKCPFLQQHLRFANRKRKGIDFKKNFKILYSDAKDCISAIGHPIFHKQEI